jgi:hypothetical protein
MRKERDIQKVIAIMTNGKNGAPCGACLELKEHEAAKWLSKEELYSVDWLPADLDLLPIVGREL